MDNNQATKFDNENMQERAAEGADERVDGVSRCEDSTDGREDATDRREVSAEDREDVADQYANAATPDVAREEQDADVGTVGKIIGMVESANLEFFRSPGTEGKAYCMLPDQLGGAVEIDSDRFRSWLRTMVYKVKGKRPKRSTVKLVVEHFVDEGLANAPEHTPVVRFAFREGVATLDIGDSTNRAIVVDKTGWRIVDKPEVEFIRNEGMRPMLIPVEGGCIDDWRETANVAEEDWPIFVPAILAMFRADAPTPILQVCGEQGSAKSSLCEQIRALVDPNQAPLRGRPKSEWDIFVSARQSRLMVYDNLSNISPEISDALCRLATGGAFSTRVLRSNTGELLINAIRPVIINGITDLSRRGDLLSRIVTVNCPRIEEKTRRTKEDVDARFEELAPRILGALLTAFAGTLEHLPHVNVEELPRMADFARFGVAAEAATGMPKGSFLKGYARNQSRLDDIALEGEPVAMVLLDWHRRHGDWEGVSRKLLRAIEGAAKKAGVSRERGSWPASPFALTTLLRRIAPNLRSKGIEVVIGGHTRDGVLININSTATTAV